MGITGAYLIFVTIEVRLIHYSRTIILSLVYRLNLSNVCHSETITVMHEKLNCLQSCENLHTVSYENAYE